MRSRKTIAVGSCLVAVVAVVGGVFAWRSCGDDRQAAAAGETVGAGMPAGGGPTASRSEVGETRRFGRIRSLDGSASRGSEPGRETVDDRAPALPTAGTSTITTRGLEVVHVADRLVDECYELARQRDPNLRGTLQLTVHIKTEAEHGNLVASAELDRDGTTITDKELIECATENVFAAEELLDELKQAGDPTGGQIELRINKTFPPPPKKKPDWPPDDASPTCSPGTTLRGERGTTQWCERADGTKDGQQFIWEEGRLQYIQLWQDGVSDSMLIRPRG